MPIIKIIKKGDGYTMGEILEVSKELADKLILIGTGEQATPTQLMKWEEYKLGTSLKKKLKSEKIDEIRYTKIKIDNYMQNAEYFHTYNPYFYDEVGIFWFWDQQNYKYVQHDEIDVMNLFDKVLGFDGQTVSRNTKSNYLEAFKRVGRLKKPKEAPVKWVQFKDKAYSISSNMIYSVTEEYFFTNPIPFSIGTGTDTPIMDKLFEDWVGKDNVQTLYEIIAYCCYRAYPMQVLFSLVGNGRNGKSCFLRLLARFIGHDNVCSTELDLLVGNQSSRFESFKMYKKLVCIMGETNFGTLNKSSMLKKLTGGDMIGYEMKGKKPFDDYNYAKMIISSNSLPTSDDTSEGFYRRWIIIDFFNEFEEGRDILESIPDQEYNNLALKVINILPRLINTGKFHNQGDISERKTKYILSSNPLSIFIKLCCDKNDNAFVSYGELYTAYVTFLKHNKKRRVKLKEFRMALEDEGYWIDRTTKKVDDDFKVGNWINGIELKQGFEQYVNYNYDNYVNYRKNPSRKLYIEESSGNSCITGINCINKKERLFQEIKLKSITCSVHNCKKLAEREDSKGMMYCLEHIDLMGI